jgi:hypothetical protein
MFPQSLEARFQTGFGTQFREDLAPGAAPLQGSGSPVVKQ